MRTLLLLLLASGPAPAQWISAGIKAGVPVTAALRGYNSNSSSLLDTGRWTVGPMLEFNLTHGFAIEADALYRGYRLQDTFIGTPFEADGTVFPPFAITNQSNNKVWDFPLLLKYRIGSRAYRPYVSAGYNWSHRTTDVASTQFCLGNAASCSTSFIGAASRLQLRSESAVNSGPASGVGVEFRYRKIKITPEVRYTHLSNPTSNNVTILVGFGF